MVPFWILCEESSVASVTEIENEVVFSNRYIKRIISRLSGITVSIADGDGTEALASPVREGEVSVNGVKYALEGEFSLNIKEGNVTNKGFDYTPVEYNTHPYPYPAPGKVAELTYDYEEFSATVIYEIFDNMPIMRKSLYVKNTGDKTLTVDTAETENLCFTDEGRLRFYMEADYVGGNGTGFYNDTSIFYDGNTVSAHFDMGPDYDLAPGEVFRGMQVYEIFCQSRCFDHRMNEVQNMYRRVAPWVNEAPMYMHLISDNSAEIRRTADELSEIGFDMIIQSFGSGINMESEDEGYIERVRSDYDYVHSKGMRIGGYTLAIIKDYKSVNHDCATNGDHSQISRCLCTAWSEGYWSRVLNFIKKTGTDFIEIDGPYHFYLCTGNKPGQTEHKHKGLSDSRYMQWLKSSVEIYARMRQLGLYINAPDWQYLAGTNKNAAGYEEIAFSQPRTVQLLVTRIYGYKGTYHKIPSMGWGFLPIDEYHGGDKAASFEPLTDNLADYDWALAQAAASGIWPCVRGKKVYDSPQSKAVIKYWCDLIKHHRKLLNSNTVHVYPPKPTGNLSIAEDIDVILQEDSSGCAKLFLMVCNQTLEKRSKTLVLPAFFTGLTDLQRPPVAPKSGSFDDVVIPSFGSWPPKYPEDIESELCGYVPSEDSGVHMWLFEHDMPDKLNDAYIDINGNLIMDVELEPMTYTFYVGYKSGERPDKPVVVPEGKPFGCNYGERGDMCPLGIINIDFDKIKGADSVEKVLEAMGLPQNPDSIDGNKIVVKNSTYARIHEVLHQYQPDTSMNTIYAMAYIGFYTCPDSRIGEDEIWLLEGWNKR